MPGKSGWNSRNLSLSLARDRESAIAGMGWGWGLIREMFTFHIVDLIYHLILCQMLHRYNI
jgi:hypothetical protein